MLWVLIVVVLLVAVGPIGIYRAIRFAFRCALGVLRVFAWLFWGTPPHGTRGPLTPTQEYERMLSIGVGGIVVAMMVYGACVVFGGT